MHPAPHAPFRRSPQNWDLHCDCGFTRDHFGLCWASLILELVSGLVCSPLKLFLHEFSRKIFFTFCNKVFSIEIRHRLFISFKLVWITDCKETIGWSTSIDFAILGIRTWLKSFKWTFRTTVPRRKRVSLRTAKTTKRNSETRDASQRTKETVSGPLTKMGIPILG